MNYFMHGVTCDAINQLQCCEKLRVLKS